MSKQLFIIASTNKGKIAEIESKFSTLDIQCMSAEEYLGQNVDVEETGTTFEENALLKAKEISKFIPDQIVIADDSGLIVDAMPNELGVYSARFMKDSSYEEKCDEVIKRVNENGNRAAKFISSMVMIKPDNTIIQVIGEVEGTINEKQEGTNGFGYDPIFFYPPMEKTTAQMSKEEKNSISHRGKALDKLYQEYLKTV